MSNCVFSKLFVILLINFGCFWRIHLLKPSDESTVWVGSFCSAAGYSLLSPRLCSIFFLQKIASLYRWSVRPGRAGRNYITIGSTLKLSTKIRQKLFLSTLATTLRCYAEGNWYCRVCTKKNLRILRFVRKHRYKVLVNFWRSMWTDLHFKSVYWFCYRWKTSWIEYYLQ